MQKWQTMAALAAGVGLIFVAGVMLGKRMPGTAGSPDPQVATGAPARPTAAAAHGGSAPPTAGDAVSRGKMAVREAEQQVVLLKIRNARLLPEGARTKPLLLALEESTKLDLTQELLDELRSIVKEGETQSSDYVLSLMEQREDKAAVALLLEAAAHSNADVASRALFALEAVAGNVFKDREAAAAWAASWQPEADRANLFSPRNSSDNDDLADDPARQPGPMRNVKKAAAAEPVVPPTR